MPLIHSKSRRGNQIIRWARFDPKQVLALVNPNAGRTRQRRVHLEIEGQKILVYMDTTTMLTYAREQSCYACNIEGTYLFLESNSSQKRSCHKKDYIDASFQLYARKEELLVLMTKDHLIPTSWGMDGGGTPWRNDEGGIEYNVKYKELLKETCNKIGIAFDPNVWHRTMCMYCNGNKTDKASTVTEIVKRTEKSWRDIFLKARSKHRNKCIPLRFKTLNEDAPIVDFFSVYRGEVDQKGTNKPLAKGLTEGRQADILKET